MLFQNQQKHRIISFSYFSKFLKKEQKYNQLLSIQIEIRIGRVNVLNERINRNITQYEIFKCIKNLKNNKACGDDCIINEYIKSTSNQFIELYPDRNPHWFSIINNISSENSDSLAFKSAVNGFTKQLAIVIGL
jgi:hypothetical protein